PREKPPLPLLAGRPSAAGGTPPAPPPEGAPPPASWTWSVAKLEVSDTLAKVFLEPPPLEIRIVKATVTDLSSAAGSAATVALELAELQVAPREGQDFSLAWKQLDLGIREIRVPGVLPGEPAAPAEPLRIDLERLHLSKPSVALTRTSEGIVLPTAGAPAADAAPPPADATAPPPVDTGGRPL